MFKDISHFLDRLYNNKLAQKNQYSKELSNSLMGTYWNMIDITVAKRFSWSINKII